jgi:hypothetical protein
MTEFWTQDRLQEAAVAELLRHGGSKQDADRLREHFRKATEAESEAANTVPEA